MYDHGTTIVRGLTLVEALDTRRNEVWRAVASGDDGETAAVAVKLLHPAYEPILPQRIGRRSRALSRVVEYGTGWVPLLDRGYTTDGRRYVVSPLHRSSLADQLEHGPTPWYPAARLIADASFTVSEAHAAGYSLGHLRPSGILINGPAEVHVVVYGMSTRRFDDGTAQFMAPELTDDGRPLPPSDVYSLALILASLIAGRPIDHGESRSDVIDELAGTAPGRIAEIIEYGLSAGLRNRYADAGKFARTLEAALQEPSDTARRGQSAPPPDAVDPLPALLAEPLVGVRAHVGDDDTARDTAGALEIPDLRDPSQPDETPTAVPFDAPFEVPSIGIDDPTDPGIAARRELDTETDHFGSVAHIDDRSVTGDRRTAGPLSDLLTVAEPPSEDSSGTDTSGREARRDLDDPIDRLGDDEPDRSDGPQRGLTAEPEQGPRATTRRPSMGSIIDIEERTDGSPAIPLRPGPEPTEPATPRIEPSRMFVLADNVSHFLALHRRRVASSVVIVGITGVVGAAILIGVGDLLRDDVTVTDGTPVSSSVVDEQTTIDRSSPLNDQAPLDNARSLSYDDIPTTRPLRTTAKSESASTTAEVTTTTVEPSTSAVDDNPATTDRTESTTETTGRGRRTTTTAAPPTTEETTTTERQTTTTELRTTTTEASTSTTKRRGPPSRP